MWHYILLICIYEYVHLGGPSEEQGALSFALHSRAFHGACHMTISQMSVEWIFAEHTRHWLN